MKYSRNSSTSGAKRKPQYLNKSFEVGVNEGRIFKVEMTKSRNGSDMLRLLVRGENKESAFYFLTMGNDYTEDNMNRLLMSIEDNAVKIPDLSFGYNQKTCDFLREKEVYIQVGQSDNEKYRNPIDYFLTLEEFENGGISFDDEEDEENDTFDDEEDEENDTFDDYEEDY